jgi:NADPH:quinone reductase-like Zn-dependent oxidoreductase
MVAIVHDRYGEADGLRSDIVPIPSPGPHEVRVRVRAVSLNPADKFLMRGNPRMIRLVYGLRKPRVRVRGQDFAGVVDAVGDGVSTLAVGDEVFGEISGTLAEYAVGSADHMAPTPHGLTFEHAAAIPMAGLAALHLLRASGVGNGTRLLINGASGGIGTFAIQIARARGAEVTAVCSTRNLDLMASLGASLAIDYTARNVLDTERRYDVILDNVGNHRIREWLPLLRPGGILLPNTGEPGPTVALWHA